MRFISTFIFFYLSALGLLAQTTCDITGTSTAGSTPCGSGSSPFTITIKNGGTLNVNSNINWTSSGTVNIIVESGGTLNISKNDRLTLSSTSVFTINSGGDLKPDESSNGVCTGATRLVIGSRSFKCNGGTDGFDDLETQGGANSSGLLPVDLITFRVLENDEGNMLFWKTASELNNDRFIVQRKITSEDTFSNIAVVLGNGTTNSITKYSYLDKMAPTSGKYCYRL